MARFDWQSLAPVQPLTIGDARYVRRPWGGGEPLADMVRHSLTPLLVAGATGSGKTTELRHARSLLEDEMLILEVSTNEIIGEEELDPGRLIYEIARHLLDKVIENDPNMIPSRGLVNDIRASDPSLPRGGGIFRQPVELAILVIKEIKEMYGRERVALFIDGLDKTPGDRARKTVLKLLELRDEAELAIIASPTLVYGPESHELLGNSRVWWIPTAPVRDLAGRRFLSRIVAQRLGRKRLPTSLVALCDEAARQSGGATRLFLQLVQDAALYAVAAGRARPTLVHLGRALRDRRDALRRLLIDGDIDVIRQADEVDGHEIPFGRKVRLLTQNLLLEYAVGEERVVRPHPLLSSLLTPRDIPREET